MYGLLVLAVWLLLLTVAFNLVLGHRLDQQTANALRDKAKGAAAMVSISSGTVSMLDSATDAFLDSGVWAYSGNRVVHRSPGDPGLQQLAKSLAGHGPRYADHADQRLYALPLYRGGIQVATVVAAVSLEPYEHAAQVVLWGSIILAALLLAGAYPVLRTATGRALRPVDTMTAQIADWSANALDQRLGQHQQFRELETLAHHLDAVMDRLSAVVRHEQRLPAELSHELRTPLSLITAETDLLLARPRSRDHTHSAATAIHDAAGTMQRILDTLLSTARAQTTTAPGRSGIADVLAQLTPSALRMQREIHIDVKPTDLTAGVDAAVLERILSPIIENACRHAQHTVRVSASRVPDGVIVDVADDGPGITDGLQESIFQPGFRGEPADGHHGAGLGLALARRLAHASDGNVTVIGHSGTSIFRVQLPAG